MWAMAKFKNKLKACELRQQGKSIKEIAKLVSVSKSSVSIWCRDIILTKKQKERLKQNAITAGHKGRLIGAETNHKRKKDTIDLYEEAGREEIKNLSDRDILISAVSLYWAEGSKTDSRFIFVNSDPVMIKMMYYFILNISKSNIKPTIQINHVHKSRIGKVVNFWSHVLKIPKTQFNKPYHVMVKPKKIYDNHDTYFGTLRLGVVKGSLIQYKFLGLIKALHGNLSG